MWIGSKSDRDERIEEMRAAMRRMPAKRMTKAERLDRTIRTSMDAGEIAEALKEERELEKLGLLGEV